MTVGYGDITPKTNVEKACIFLFPFSTIVFVSSRSTLALSSLLVRSSTPLSSETSRCSFKIWVCTDLVVVVHVRSQILQTLAIEPSLTRLTSSSRSTICRKTSVPTCAALTKSLVLLALGWSLDFVVRSCGKFIKALIWTLSLMSYRARCKRKPAWSAFYFWGPHSWLAFYCSTCTANLWIKYLGSRSAAENS